MLNFIFGLKNHIVIIFQNERRIQMKFKEIEVGKSEQIRALLTGIEERGSKAGTRYLILNFTDGEQTVTANYWNCTREEFTAKEGQVLDLRVDAKLYKGSTSYTVQSYLLTDESPEAYVTSAPMDPVYMFNKIHSFATGLGVYGMLVCTLLEENREKLLTWAAGKSVHHNIRGGLLYHTYTMLQSASQLYKVYKNILPLDRDLLFAGVILHDIGKVRELSCSSIMSIDYTPDGNLLGHLFIGAEMVGECAKKLGLPEEKTLLLQHMLLSHHGKREMGAVTLPAIPEASILHHVDCMDAEMYMFRSAREETKPGEMSDRLFALDCRVYNPKN